MSTPQDRLVELYKKRVNNTLSEAEAEEFSRLLHTAEAEQTLSPLLYEGWTVITAQNNVTGLSEEQIDELMASLPVTDEAHQGEVVNGRLRFIRHWWAAAAVVLVLAGIAWLALSRKATPVKEILVKKETAIEPGKDGAILTLADGTQVLLDSIQNGVVAHQGGADVRINEGVLYYEGKSSEVMYNTMHTPRGRKYNITLPDGTLVWLNAASSIRYPTAFAGKERKVEITGEVYMEVAKQTDKTTGKRIPFIVDVNHQAEVQVLGTHFNINAYDNDPWMRTTLLEGKVRVSRKDQQVLLEPGEQAQIPQAQLNSTQQQTQTTQAIRVVNDADLDQVIAWKNDLFNFDGTGLEEAMHQLERWYDISVVYENGVPDKVSLRGEMTKGVKLDQLLIALKQLGLHYKLEGRKLIVLP